MIYDNLYNLIATYVFNNSVVVGSHQDLICILVSTLGCLFLVALPFLVVLKIIKLILN